MTKKRRHRRKKGARLNPAALAFVAILLIVLIAGVVLLVRKYSPSKERMNSELYYRLEDKDELAVIVQDELIEDKGIVLDGRPYVSTAVIKNYLNDRFYWDSTENLFIYTTPTEMITAHVGDNSYSVDKQNVTTDYQVVKVESETAYVALDFVKLYTALDYEYIKEPNRVHITCEYGERTVAEAKKNPRSDTARVLRVRFLRM